MKEFLKRTLQNGIKLSKKSLKEDGEELRDINIGKTDLKSTIKQVRDLEIKTKRLVEGLISGNYHSIFKGSGIEFIEIRDYIFGDDVRTIDWKVTARFDKPHIKNFIEERDQNVYFILDLSASGGFGNNIEKRSKSIEIVASLMFSAMKNNDAVGIFIVTDRIEKYIPARKGRKFILGLVSKILSFEPESKNTDLVLPLKAIVNLLKKRSIIFMISDFYSDDFSKPLKVLGRRHDLIALKVIDKREKEIPNVGYIQLEDEETGEQLLVDTTDEEFREKYLKVVKDYDVGIEKLFRKYKIDLIEILTEESYEKPLKKFFKNRKYGMVR